MSPRIVLFALMTPLLLSGMNALGATLSGAHSHPAAKAAQGAPLTQNEQAAHVVDRFTFGPTPGMVQAVAAEGWRQWFAQQLDPDSIPDPALAKRLAAFPSLQMTPAQMAVALPDAQVIRRIAMGKEAMPTDPRLAAAYQVMLTRYEAKQAKNRADASVPGRPQAASSQRQTGTADTEEQRVRAGTLAGPILALPPGKRLDAVLALPVPDRMALTRGLAGPMREQLLAGVAPRDRELWGMMAGGYGANGVAANELQQAKLLRVILSQRQLQEVMTDFWVNHFNIDLGKSGDEILYANQFEQEAIRPHALGKFRDLLLATAQSPAMLIYLDNATSVGPGSLAAMRQRQNGKPLGLNENYGREVMELHTVGVNGGYTQADVIALSEILTGWTIDRPQQGGPFVFEQRRHQPGAKQWMSHTVAENGRQEGIDALSYLADQPATARHICSELAERFVADDPPPALVDRMVAAWQSSDGDIAQVLRAMVQSPEFFARSNFRNKVKSPLELVASAMRATAADPSNPAALANEVRLMGEPLYRCLPPTGYPDTSVQWMNSAALIDRLNFVLALADGKLGGIHLNAPLLVATGLMDAPADWPEDSRGSRRVALVQARPESGEDRALALMERALVAGQISAQTNRVIEAQLAQRSAEDPAAKMDAMAAMILGSPEFQMH